ncbi:N-6 DNA methylase [Melioribacter sp. Ez-97]|jgi:type I restriction enzyme M protein|uniref:class I SAM-dependent DNA methyltransferase n=1 Tax=Melioribacter sp. Ez-97 TaxID=3423434 RepID=UPI003EDB599A
MLSKQALGNTLWGLAEILYSKVEDYKTYILSLLFFKRISDNYHWETQNEIKAFKEEYGREPNAKQLKTIKEKKHTFIIPDGCFWQDVKDAPPKKKNEVLANAVQSIAEANANILPQGIINAVNWNAPAPDGKGGKRLSPELLISLINYMDAVKLDNDNVSVDVLGDAYEYLIKKFADENKGGKVAAQFYTPQEVVDIIVRYIKPEKGSKVYDPYCGSGGFLINSAKFVKETDPTANSKNPVQIYGQEIVWNTWAIANINLVLHGFEGKIAQGDTIRDPKFLDENNDIEKFKYIFANFPFSQENWWGNGKPKKNKKGQTVYKKDGSPQMEYPSKEDFSDPFNRFDYGIPPYSNGDFAFIQHIIASLDEENGRAGVVCPQGVLFRGQPEKTEEEDGQNRKADDEYLIRRGFIEGKRDLNNKIIERKNIIEAIVVLPANLFYGTTIPAAIIFFNKNKPEEIKDKILMVYAAREGWYKEESNLNILLPHDILRILVQLEAWGDIEVAKRVIPIHEKRLNKMIEENLLFTLGEIDLEYEEEVKQYNEIIEKLKKDGLKKAEKNKLTKRLERLEKILEKKENKIKEAKENAEKERAEIERVKTELMNMFADPEERKRYFSIVDLEEIEENEFNLNIPRYVDTFEPEEEIDLNEAVKDFVKLRQVELTKDEELTKILNLMSDE